MRWDDTEGLVILSLERRARGVFAFVDRTKTSGPGKKPDVLPAFVSEEAYVRTP